MQIPTWMLKERLMRVFLLFQKHPSINGHQGHFAPEGTPILTSSQTSLLKGTVKYIDINLYKSNLIKEYDYIAMELQKMVLPWNIFEMLQRAGSKLEEELAHKSLSLIFFSFFFFQIYIYCFNSAFNVY
ncbi:hypothetical protein CROQUDRAFT_279181 [Cronartium quercuum f. sp. fusiforme G11]|uniref:Uncharacterized protein n=1 Tax=Cronartium quercuum f. sp. fusiforme G11 TaxID=708437 RepID=A0A9P6NPN4_9BASI|nr:hypothetical protein CROQUDRAFT_279181 [Cronartium quercuum f. sp. fusiforme G11]